MISSPHIARVQGILDAMFAARRFTLIIGVAAFLRKI
jgi:hypothetical protein